MESWGEDWDDRDERDKRLKRAFHNEVLPRLRNRGKTMLKEERESARRFIPSYRGHDDEFRRVRRILEREFSWEETDPLERDIDRDKAFRKGFATHLLQLYREAYESGHERVLHDCIAVAGPDALRAEWVLDAIEDRWLILHEDPKATPEEKKKADRFLSKVGEALKRRGQGRPPNPAQEEALFDEYEETLPKVQRMARPARQSRL